MGELTRERFYLDNEAGGKRGLVARPEVARRGPANRPSRTVCATLLTTCRGVSRREAMVSLERPWAAIRTILARITSRYGDVYLRTLDFNSCRSSFVRTTVKGLCLGIEATSAETIVTQKYVIVFMKTST